MREHCFVYVFVQSSRYKQSDAWFKKFTKLDISFLRLGIY